MTKDAKERTTPHERLTTEDVVQGWLMGDYTASGYLYHLIRTLRKDGWWFKIPNISEFCRKYKIGRRAFYRAKARLVLDGRLQEHANEVDLRIVSEAHSCDTEDTETIDITAIETVSEAHSCVASVTERAVSQTHSCIPNGTLNRFGYSSCIPNGTLNHLGYNSIPVSFTGWAFQQPYRSYTDLYTDLLQKREREGSEPVGNFAAHPDISESVLPVNETVAVEDQGSAPFDPDRFNWASYQQQGDGGSDPRYWDFALDKVTALNERRIAKGKERIDDIRAYTLAYIQQGGAAKYRVFLQSIENSTSIPSRALVWSDTWADEGLEFAEAVIRSRVFWDELGLTWASPDWLAWLEQAQACQSFSWNDRSGWAHMPEWVVRKLAYDLALAMRGHDAA